MEHNNSGMMAAMLTTDILVYDWDGKCVCRFVSDIPLFNICVTDDDKQLMALGWEEDFHLYSFDLSQIPDLVK